MAKIAKVLGVSIENLVKFNAKGKLVMSEADPPTEVGGRVHQQRRLLSVNMRFLKITSLVIVVLIIISLAFFFTLPKEQKNNSKNTRILHYQLQNANFENLRDLDADVLIIDIDEAKLTQSQIKELKNGGKNIILSYLSIGEAENYRDYWQPDWKPNHPDFIDAENPDWEGNFKVRYWQPAWQEVIFNGVKRIGENGYDGAYLDIVDAYEYYKGQGRESSAREMIDFVGNIRYVAKRENPNFLIVPQNAPELYEFDDYRKVIDGLGGEDTWYMDDMVRDKTETERVLKFLDAAIMDGKFILAIDYPTDKANARDFYEKCRAHRFLCTVSNRELDLPRPVWP